MLEIIAKAIAITWALLAGWFLNDFFTQDPLGHGTVLGLTFFTVTYVMWVGTRPVEVGR